MLDGFSNGFYDRIFDGIGLVYNSTARPVADGMPSVVKLAAAQIGLAYAIRLLVADLSPPAAGWTERHTRQHSKPLRAPSMHLFHPYEFNCTHMHTGHTGKVPTGWLVTPPPLKARPEQPARPCSRTWLLPSP